MVSLHAALAAIVLSSTSQTVMLDFYADWCGPCKAMEPTIKALQEKGYPIQKVNIDQNPALAAKYGVRSVPCFVMLVDDQEADRVMGGTTYSRLEKMFKITSPPQGQNLPPGQLAQNNLAPNNFPPQAAVLPASRTMPGSSPRQDDPNVVPASFVSAVNTTPGERNPALDSKLLAASVRLRIEDANGNSCGSGTIIDVRGGKALILTCGHIFRDSQGKGKIDVDLFGPFTGQRVAGQLLDFDLKSDVGLIAIPAPGALMAARLAPPGFQVRKGDRVASVGCDSGKDPGVRYSHVTSLNRYAGPPNLQVAGQPTEGRSGGGLFSSDGLVIGVCNARDPQDQEGYYAALDTICAIMDHAQLAFVYQAPKGYEGAVPENTGQQTLARAAPPAELNPTEQAAMDEIRRRLKEGAEVVCIVRSRRDPTAKSEVIMLDKASPEFLQQLATETQAQTGRQETSLELPRTRQPALEWSANPNSKSWRQGQ